MDDEASDGTAAPTGARRPRQGEAFWREIVSTLCIALCHIAARTSKRTIC